MLVIGIQGAIKAVDASLLILSLVLGAIIGEALNIELVMKNFSYKYIRKNHEKNSQEFKFVQGFLSAIMIFCVGAIAIEGSLQSGLLGDHSMLYSKGIIDGIIAMLLAATKGVRVLFHL